MQTITPFLWFDGKAEQAMNFYVAVFRDAKVVNVTRAGPKGPVISATFELLGQRFIALNGGPQYSFTPAVSFFVSCETQSDIDYYWTKLTDGGTEQPCGWLVDRYGLSWQIVPPVLGSMLGDSDPARSGRAMKAMLAMRKLDIAELTRAYEGR